MPTDPDLFDDACRIPATFLEDAPERRRIVDGLRLHDASELEREIACVGQLAIAAVQDALITRRVEKGVMEAARLGAQMAGLIIERRKVDATVTTSPMAEMTDAQLIAARERLQKETT